MNSHFDLAPAQRWEEQRRATAAADPWQDHSRVLLRNSEGRLVQVDRTVTDQRVDEATWNQMTYPEKVAYAARMSGQK